MLSAVTTPAANKAVAMRLAELEFDGEITKSLQVNTKLPVGEPIAIGTFTASKQWQKFSSARRR